MTMEQRPVDGHDPLAPPTADIAQAYLDELSAVQSRREEHVDRRGAAWLALAEAITISVYVTIAGFAIGMTSANSAFLIVLALFLLWTQLGNERREELGGINRSRARTWVAGIGIGALMIIFLLGRLVAALVGGEIPLVIYFLPGLIALAVVGVPAVRDIRAFRPVGEQPRHRHLTTPERWATVTIGVIMAGSIWVLGVGSELLILTLAPVLMFAYLAWWVAGRISERLPVLGAVWAWPQWLAFILGGVAVTATISVQLLGLAASASTFAPLAAVVILLVFVASAFMDGRDG
ncbi:hypothetical protein [Microbacterium sp. A94]|uniref:hypothetical protein n=1 Tax=Microbacterium sp. A94 TaxID=3450717 RepID=UPI003F42040B